MQEYVSKKYLQMMPLLCKSVDGKL